MKHISADWIFTSAGEPLKNGILAVSEDGTILDIIDPDKGYAPESEHYEGFICPGFVNAHCHLELSHMKGKIEKGLGLDAFIRSIEKQRKAEYAESDLAMQDAVHEMITNGIVAVGDISNGARSFSLKTGTSMRFHTFIEIFAFDAARAESAFERGRKLHDDLNCIMESRSPQTRQKVSLTLHAPYSASEKLMRMTAEHASAHGMVLSVHNQESEDENLLYLWKQGKLIGRLSDFGIDLSAWQAPGMSSLQFLMQFMPENVALQLVHNTVTTKEEIQLAHSMHPGIRWCFCPNANLYIEKRLPDFDAFLNAGACITLGTDSLASNDRLCILEEMKTIAQAKPDYDLNMLIGWATRNGAELLGFLETLGTLEPGKKPGLVHIRQVDRIQKKLTPRSVASRII
jgi:cytosine/adenosine deaminase-related metal-dependent hydrolase